MKYSCFFFSGRRRHTRLQGDWSSDVCSSDLPRHAGGVGRDPDVPLGRPVDEVRGLPDLQVLGALPLGRAPATAVVDLQVGRDEVELVTLRAAEDERVAHAGLTVLRLQDGPAAVELV